MNNITINLKISISPNDNFFEKILKIITQLKDCEQWNINDSNNNITIGETLNIYVIENNLKDDVIPSYKAALKFFFGTNWSNFLITNISINQIKDSRNNIKKISKKEYMKRVIAILRWLHIKYSIPIAEVENYYKTNFKNIRCKPREAINCNDWICVQDAQKAITNLFRVLKKDNENLYYCLILHFILATRIKETHNFLKEFKKRNNIPDYIYIDTKTTKKNEELHFRIPITFCISEILKKISKIYAQTTFISIMRSFLKTSNLNITLHGTRAIYRTSIDFLTQNLNISTEAKEKYIDHAVGNKIFKTYQRQDYFIERIKIQSIYAYFIFECAGLTNMQKKVIDYINTFNKKYPEHSFSIQTNLYK